MLVISSDGLVKNITAHNWQKVDWSIFPFISKNLLIKKIQLTLASKQKQKNWYLSAHFVKLFILFFTIMNKTVCRGILLCRFISQMTFHCKFCFPSFFTPIFAIKFFFVLFVQLKQKKLSIFMTLIIDNCKDRIIWNPYVFNFLDA